MLAALERLTLTATRALSVVGLIALMGLAAMTLTDGLLRWLANQPIDYTGHVLTIANMREMGVVRPVTKVGQAD